jgi:acyl-CoA thioester hydrolase
MIVHETQLRVRYSETDKMGFAYYGRFYEWFEVGRVEFLRKLGYRYRDLEGKGLRLAVMESYCRHHSPAYYDELLTIKTWIKTLKRLKIEFEYEIFSEAGKPVASGRTVLGSLTSKGEPVAMLKEVEEVLKKAL